MSYSRWGARGSGHWYTFYSCASGETKDDQVFCICDVADFTYKELSEDMPTCMKAVHKIDPVGDLKELEKYAREFMDDVEEGFD